jgi:hypothetical protein
MAKEQEAGENFVIRAFVISVPHQLLEWSQFTKVRMCESCTLHGREENCLEF